MTEERRVYRRFEWHELPEAKPKMAFINPVVSWTNEARQARYVEGRIIYRESIKHLFKETKNAE